METTTVKDTGYTFREGDTYKVYNGFINGKPRLEGHARLVKPKRGFINYWDVEFEDEPGTLYPRFVMEGELVQSS